MKKEFLDYTEALELKELGFDEPCLAFWDGKNTDAFYFNNIRDASGDYTPFQKHDRLKWFGAPLYQQAFRWFREKYELEGITQQAEDFAWYKWKISQYNEDGKKYVADWYEYETYEEAELECIKKLIQIVKEKQL